MNDKVISLKNGLNIGVLEFGDLNSNEVVFYLHGFPGCRYEPLFTEKYALNNHVKMISIDRIGYGNTSYYKKLTVLNFGEIFEELVNALNIDKFKIIAVSGGSPYLASVCYTLKDRVKKAVLVSGLSPLDNKNLLKDLNIANKCFLSLGLKFPKITSCLVYTISSIWKLFPNVMIMWLRLFMSKADNKLLSLKDNNNQIKKVFNEAVKNGVWGIKKDFELYCKPWNIDFTKINTPIIIYHGDDDPYVTFKMGEYLNSLYKESEFNVLKGQGHLAIINHAKEMFDKLCNDN